MRYLILLTVLFTGCSEAQELTALKLSLRSTGNEILSATTSTGDKIDENTEALRDLKTQVETLKASLVSSDPQGKESDPASRTAPSNNANDSQTATMIVAAPGAVRLIVSLADFACAPCDRLKRAVDTGEFKGFAVEYSEDWKPRAYPAIRYPTASSPTGWAVMYGFDDTTVSRVRAATNPVVMKAESTKQIVRHESLVAQHNRLHGGGNWTWPGSTQQSLANHLRDAHGVNLASSGGAPVGAIFQNYRAGTVTNQRPAVRSVSRWFGFSGRSRNTSWQSNSACPNCPR